MQEHYDALWAALPDPLGPPDQFESRRAFLLEHVEPGLRVLDLGCGAGHFLAALHEAGAEPTGVDVAAEALRRSAALAPAARLERAPYGEPLPLDDASFDLVWAGEVIEHVADTAAWLSEVRRVLRPAGRLALSTPYHGPMKTLGLALSPGRFERHFDPQGDHLRFYSRRSLRALLHDFGFEDVALRVKRGTILASAARAGVAR